MAFPLSNTQLQPTVMTLLNDMVNLRSYCLEVRAETAGGSTAAVNVLNVAVAIQQYQTDYNAIISKTAMLNALETYINQQLVATIDYNTEFTNINNATTALLNAIGVDYPRDAQGHLLDRTYGAGGVTNVMLSAAQLPNTLPAINTLLAQFA